MTTSLSLGTIIRYSWLIALLAIIPGVAVYLVTSSMPKEYAAEARLLVGSLTATDLQEQLGYEKLAQVYAALVTTPLVLDPVALALEGDASAAELADRVSATTPVDQSVLIITATGATPAEAGSFASAVAESVVELATPEQPNGLAAAAQPVAPLAQVIQPASADDEPSAPSVLFDTLIATVVGLGLGLLLAMLLATRAESRRREPEPELFPDPRAYPAGPYPR